MTITTKILSAIGLFAALLAPSAFAAWTIHESKNEMTDEISVSAASDWTKPKKKMAFPYGDMKAVLGVSCDSEGKQVYVKSNKLPSLHPYDNPYIEGDLSKIMIRFDKEMAREELIYVSSDDDSFRFYSDLALWQFGKHNSMLLELDINGRNNAYFSFGLSGAAKAISQIREKCGFAPIVDGALLEAASGGYAKIVKELLAEGANPNAKNKFGETTLMKATDYPEIVKMLLSAGADVNAKTKTGWTALDSATGEYIGNAESAKLLREAGAK